MALACWGCAGAEPWPLQGSERLHLVKTQPVNALKCPYFLDKGLNFHFPWAARSEAASPGFGSDYLSTQGGRDNYATSAVMGDEARWTVSPRPPRGTRDPQATHAWAPGSGCTITLLPVLGWLWWSEACRQGGGLFPTLLAVHRLQILCGGHRSPPLCLGRRPASHDALAASPVDLPILAGRHSPPPRPPSNFTPSAGGRAQRAEHPCAHAAPSHPRRCSARARAQGVLMLPARGQPLPPLPQVCAAAAALDGHPQGQDQLQKGQYGGGGWGPPNQALGLAHPPAAGSVCDQTGKRVHFNMPQFMETSRSRQRQCGQSWSPSTRLCYHGLFQGNSCSLCVPPGRWKGLLGTDGRKLLCDRQAWSQLMRAAHLLGQVINTHLSRSPGRWQRAAGA